MDAAEPRAPRKYSFRNSLLVRLATLFGCLLFLAGMILLSISTRGYHALAEEIEQELNWNVAADVAQRLQPFLDANPSVDQVNHLIYDYRVSNPRMEFYFLDANGFVYREYSNGKEIHSDSVDMKPLLRALEPPIPDLPLYGEDPGDYSSQRVFSVAPIRINGKPGYLYIIVWSFLLDFLMRMSGQFYVVRTVVAGAAVSIAFAWMGGLLLHYWLVRRFQELRKAIELFEQGDFAGRALVGRQDEIGEIALAFNRMAERIAENTDELQRKDELRRNLVATISHDLRGPVGAVLGYAETMLDSELDADTTKRCANAIYQSAALQQALITDLFQLSRLEAQEARAYPEYIDIVRIINSVVDVVIPEARQSGISLSADLPPELPRIFADSQLLYRALMNLVTNAVRYTPAGGTVTVSAQNLESKISIEVQDTGMGIPEGDLPFIFESFYRVKRKQERTAGTGLGLAIVKKVIDLHQAELRVESTVNVGTKFTLLFKAELVTG